MKTQRSGAALASFLFLLSLPCLLPGIAGASSSDLFPDEPSARETQVMAVRYAQVSDESLRSYQNQARWTNILPQTRLRFHASQTMNVAIDPTTAQQNLGLVDNIGNQYDVELSWRLDQLMMGSTRVQAIRETSRLVLIRQDLLEQVTRVYFDRRRLQVELRQAPPADPKVRLGKEIRLEELTATLDGLTGGEFRRKVEGRGN